MQSWNFLWFFFFNERHCLQTSFLVLSTSQVVYIRLKKVRFIASLFTSWSKERRTIGACNRCKVKRVKIIFFVRYYLPVFVYTTGTFRYSDMIKTSQIIKGWAITTLCPAQDYVIHIFRNVLCLFVAGFSLDCNQRLSFHFPRFTIRNRHDWMFRKIRNSNANADKFELRYKAVGRQNFARESMFNRKNYTLI